MREKKEAWGLGCRVEEQERRGWTRDRRVVERRDKGGREKAGVIHLFEKKHHFEKTHHQNQFLILPTYVLQVSQVFVTRPKQTSRSPAPSLSFLP
jgi:hypothetical protein